MKSIGRPMLETELLRMPISDRARRTVLVASGLILILVAACWIGLARIAETRHDLVQMRLRTAVDIVRGRAAAALQSPEALPAFFEDLRSWAHVTGLRLTLILPDGSVLADTEVAVMPNLADRPEVRAAKAGETRVAFRRSVMTGKDTLYVATPIESEGVRLGMLRAATSALEIDGVLAGFEYVFAIIAGACLGAGALVGLAVGWRSRDRRVHLELVSDLAQPSTPARAELAPRDHVRTG